MAKRHIIPKKYLKLLLEELLQDKPRKEQLFKDLNEVMDPINRLRDHMEVMKKRLIDLEEYAKDDPYLRIKHSLDIYTYFGWLLLGIQSFTKEFEGLGHQNELQYIAQTFVEVMRKQEDTEREILS